MGSDSSAANKRRDARVEGWKGEVYMCICVCICANNMQITGFLGGGGVRSAGGIPLGGEGGGGGGCGGPGDPGSYIYIYMCVCVCIY